MEHILMHHRSSPWTILTQGLMSLQIAFLNAHFGASTKWPLYIVWPIKYCSAWDQPFAEVLPKRWNIIGQPYGRKRFSYFFFLHNVSLILHFFTTWTSGCKTYKTSRGRWAHRKYMYNEICKTLIFKTIKYTSVLINGQKISAEIRFHWSF